MYKILVFIAIVLVLNECGKLRAINRKRKKYIWNYRSGSAEKINNYLAELKANKPQQAPIMQAKTEKELIQEAKQKQRIQQAEADKQFLLQQLETIGDLILQTDAELEKINQKISADIQLKSYDKESRDRKRREQIVKKLLVLERQQHTAEAKLAKANYILQDGK